MPRLRPHCVSDSRSLILDRPEVGPTAGAMGRGPGDLLLAAGAAPRTQQRARVVVLAVGGGLFARRQCSRRSGPALIPEFSGVLALVRVLLVRPRPEPTLVDALVNRAVLHGCPPASVRDCPPTHQAAGAG
jgi:hypothetical protein